MYCTKCKMTYPDDGEWDVCPECDIKLITNKERDELKRKDIDRKTNALYESLRQEYERKGIQFTKQDFEDYLQSKRIEQLSKYKEASKNNIETKKSDDVPKCPICGSLKIQKISSMNRAVNIAIWGIFSTKINKQWHCTKCGSNF